MRRTICLILSAFLATTVLFLSHRTWQRGQAQAASQPARKVRPFSLQDVAGKTWTLADFSKGKATVVLFLGTECTVNNAYMPRIVDLAKKYKPKDVSFVALNSNCHDTPIRIAAHAKEYGIVFPVLKDTANIVADDFGAKRTPEVFVLDPAGRILYQGRIDDQFGVGFRRKAPTRQDLAAALDEVLAGKVVSVPCTAVSGCLLARSLKPKADGSITFTKHVSRILQRRCQECHRPGQVGPMSLLTYDDVRAWSGMIREVVSDDRMPPWHADPHFGKFTNDRRLTKEEKTTLLGWIKQGCPKGDAKDLPPAKTFVKGWSIGKPDVVFEMKEESIVPAKTGPKGVAYRYFRVPTNFTEDKWVQAAEAHPGARAVVHHIIVYVVPPGKWKRDRNDGIGDGFLVAYAPGDMPLVLAPGQAKKVPKGASLVFQMHYTPNGIEYKDRSSVGLVFAKKPPAQEVRTRGIAQRWLAIPAGANNYEAKSNSAFDRDVDLLSMLPHMHLRGKDFKYVAEFPNGKTQTLLSVPHYDFNWQSNYRLEKPIRLPAGTKIRCYAHFDNSTDNPNNPDPKKVVAWGDQTWQEMMIGFVDYAYVKEKETED
jgi:thiol-disulfide isomerase/thioredoxin